MPLVVHFKRPSGWRAPVNIHFWDTTPAEPPTIWPGVAMTAETNDWFVYQFATAEAASIVFNDGAGRQTGNLRRDRLGWFYTNNTWYDANPERPAIPVIRANPRARTYTTPQTVTLESSNDYDVIYYTMDGVSDPTPPSPDGTFPNASTVRYTGPVTVSQSLTIRATRCQFRRRGRSAPHVHIYHRSQRRSGTADDRRQPAARNLSDAD